MEKLIDSVGIVGIVLLAIMVAIFPATWLLMLFLGNLGTGLSFWGTLPLGVVIVAYGFRAGSSK
jgi:hypothetical protein